MVINRTVVAVQFKRPEWWSSELFKMCTWLQWSLSLLEKMWTVRLLLLLLLIIITDYYYWLLLLIIITDYYYWLLFVKWRESKGIAIRLLHWDTNPDYIKKTKHVSKRKEQLKTYTNIQLAINIQSNPSDNWLQRTIGECKGIQWCILLTRGPMDHMK